MKIIKIGHGGVLPLPGEFFFLRAQLLRNGRVRFPCTSINVESGETLMVAYSARSSARLVQFSEDQVWHVRAARLKYLRRPDAQGRMWVVVKLDLFEVYEHLVGHFDYYDKRWKVHRYESLNGPPITEIPALVRYIAYYTEEGADGKLVRKCGLYPEVVARDTGEVIIRFSPQSTGSGDEAFSMLPDDGVSLSSQCNPTKYVRLIGDPIGS